MKLEEYMRSWTDEQWADADRTADEINSLLGEDGFQTELLCLVIEERKRDPATTIKDVMSLAITLGVESLFRLRHEALKSRKACIVSPDVAALAKQRGKKPQKRGVRVVGVPGVGRGTHGVSIRES